MNGDRCKLCGRGGLQWARWPESGKASLVEPSPAGNLVLRPAERAAAFEIFFALPGDPGPRYVSHFASCPRASEARKPRGRTGR